MTDTILYLISALAFATCVAAVYAVYLMWRDAREDRGKRVDERLKGISNSGVAHSTGALSLYREEHASTLDRMLYALPFMVTVDHFLEQAGADHGPAKPLAWSLCLAIVAAVVANYLLKGFGDLGILVAFAAGLALPWIRLMRQRRARQEALVRQLPDAMDFFARSLRAGNPFISALKGAADEMPQPIASEFGTTFDEMNYGLDFDEVMRNLGARADSEEMHLFITSVLVQKSTGGNLAEVMNRIAALLRERVRTRGEVEVQASEMKASARVLIALPFVIAGLLQLVNPEYLPVLFETSSGRTIVGVQLFLMLVGYLIMRRMVNFRI